MQYVCLRCGYNMVGFYPKNCPFCGAPRTQFLTSEQASSRFHVEQTRVSSKVMALNSVPDLGYEHTAYHLQTGNREVWIDCPSSFDRRLQPVNIITFTHHHFLGASNQYRQLFDAEVQIHHLDSTHTIAQPFPFDTKFNADFDLDGIEAYHIDGHTPGFTFYIFEDLLFLCDYVFLQDNEMRFNPFGPADKTRNGARQIQTNLDDKTIRIVCGQNYITSFNHWNKLFNTLMESP